MFGLADWETFAIEHLITNIATDLLVATDKYQRTKVSSNTTNKTTCKKLTSDNAKRIIFLLWQ